VTFTDSKKRFSSRVADYLRHRPGYPPGLLTLLRDACGLGAGHLVADVGSGTGLLSRLFLENGNRVIGVEPNPEMRAAGDEFLSGYGGFSSVDGSAEATTLAGHSVDFVTAAQAFHWFEPSATRREFVRILKPGGWAVVLWNDRRIGQTAFGRGYEDLLVRYGTDYRRVKEAYPETQGMETFFGRGNFEARQLPNFQEFDFAGLAGRLASSSYAPQEGQANYPAMMAALRDLFQASQECGRVRMEYTTEIYWGRLELRTGD
jgi:SAM-dependent methyltransferase